MWVLRDGLDPGDLIYIYYIYMYYVIMDDKWNFKALWKLRAVFAIQ